MTTTPATSLRISQHYDRVRQQSVYLCTPLETEDYTVQPTEDVSPPKWHLGHSTWFFENFILAEHAPGYRHFDERLNWFFNSYYESQGPRILRSRRGNMTRPTLQVILDYRRHVDAAMQELLEKDDETVRILTTLGLHHEQQHQELLLTDIKYILGSNPLYPVYRQGEMEKATSVAHTFLSIAGGQYTIGHSGPGFCWDNELSRHDVLVEDFGIGSRLVTNGEYRAFMEDGGYERFELWQMEGIAWARELEIKAPLYWYPQGGDWKHYTLNGGLADIDPHLPVTHISWYEADAYARWAGARLATEFEWEIACRQLEPEVPRRGNWVERKDFHPTPARNADDHQLLGHCWEWTNSAYLPYPRYPRPEGALGEYNGKFMVNQMVLRGGSCATPVSHIRPTYRNFFQTDKRWQFTGIRLATDR
ncbi:ergothioneine biosynthesis protein EgtB [Neolewinella litorea]|uniref:Ergothioneine biosynthesis protein EgtB n=1 Tax=Neolewinella litorea TaxID=2562452 RepID=A0A4S4NIZ8_9BACT|nr:ergothioneine biosynthesis protein EgtB [Neolewinella litorea]THH39719.1 ergothioneine biosynthesis protein EgtB [Neolewinella litorea]